MNDMTFRQLIAKLSEIPEERLDDHAMVLTEDGEMFAVNVVNVTDEGQDILDAGHFYMGIG